MDKLRRKDLQQLLELQDEWHVSIFMPAHPIGQEHLQDPIRLKNLLSQAEKKLLEYNVRRPDAEKMLRPAQDLLNDREFWQSPGNGVAVFLSHDLSEIYRLPSHFDELAVVGKSFHVQPILPLLTNNGSFYLLLLSQNQVRLFAASRDDLSEVEMADAPDNKAEALRIDELQRNLGFHTGTDRGVSGERRAMFYGHGIEQDKKELLEQFLRYVDAAVIRTLEDTSAPLVLAGVDYLLDIFREISTYRNLLKEDISGNPDRENLAELHAEAWKLVKPIFLESQQQAVDRFLELHGQQNELATGDLDRAVKAAVGGRIETLIVPLGVQKWGRYDPSTDSIQLDSKPRPENTDLINYTAAQTLIQSGNVYAVPPEELPGPGDVAAILRYAV